MSKDVASVPVSENLPPKNSPLSQISIAQEPGRKLLSSREAKWSSLLLQTTESPNMVDRFETLPTPDQLIVMLLEGEVQIESFSSRSWKQAVFRAGQGGLRAAMNTSRLRWQSRGCERLKTLHLYVPEYYFLEAAEELRRTGSRDKFSEPDALGFADPVVFSMAKSLVSGIQQGAPNLYAEGAASFLATHLLVHHQGWSDQKLHQAVESDLTDARLMRVLDYMRQYFYKEITVKQLAREAGMSPFHFARVFKKKLGVTPHHHVVELRMSHARFLLAKTEQAVSDIAFSCGYAHAGHFAAAFKTHFAKSPATYRQMHRL